MNAKSIPSWGWFSTAITVASTVNIEEKLYSQLLSSTLITAYTTKIFPLVAPHETTPPYLIYTRNSGEYVNTLSGYVNIENPAIDITICSTGYAQAKILSNNIHAVVGGATTFKAILVDDEHGFDSETKLYIFNLNFKCINKEPA